MEYQNATWYMDSGASHHVTGNYEHLYDVGTSSSGHNVTTADGNAHQVEAIGSSTFNTGNSDGINIDHVLYVPALKKNLLSVSSLLTDQGHIIVFTGNDCVILDHNNMSWQKVIEIYLMVFISSPIFKTPQ